jgi:hypothetical protein
MTCVQNSEVPSGEGLGTGLTGIPGTTGSTTTGRGPTSGFSGTGLVLFMSLQSARLAVVPINVVKNPHGPGDDATSRGTVVIVQPVLD